MKFPCGVRAGTPSLPVRQLWLSCCLNVEWLLSLRGPSRGQAHAVLDYQTSCCSSVRLQHGNLDPLLTRGLFCLFISRVNVSRDANARIVCEHAIESLSSFICAISDRHLARVKRIADTHTATVMK